MSGAVVIFTGCYLTLAAAWFVAAAFYLFICAVEPSTQDRRDQARTNLRNAGLVLLAPAWGIVCAAFLAREVRRAW